MFQLILFSPVACDRHTCRPRSLRGCCKSGRYLSAAMLSCALLFCVLASMANAEDDGPATQPLRFIRVFVPADQPELWPRGQGRYLPVETDEFERLLEHAKAYGERTSTPPANVSAAEYRAWLEEDGILHGTARLKVSLRGRHPVLLPLAPCRLVIEQAAWDDKHTAVLGRDSRGRVGLAVERSGTLSLDWLLRGNGTPQVKAYDIELPQCPTNVLLLDLPPDFVPQVEGAIVLPIARPTTESSATESSATESSATEPSATGLRRWRIELGGRHRFTLRLPRAGKTAGGRPTAVQAKQSLVYDITEQGLEVSSAFRLDAALSPIDRVDILVDHPLQVVRAQCGDKPVNWSVMPDADGKTKRLTLELPGLIRDANIGVQVWAYGPVATGRAWRLPRIRAKSVSSSGAAERKEPIFWEQGTATLLVADPLQITDLKKIECRQSKIGRLSPPAAGESVLLQLFSPDATCEVVLAQAAAPPTVDRGIAVRLDAGDITASVTATFRGTRQKRFRIEADLAARWIVDSVESLPAGVVDDWNVVDEDSGSGGSRRLVVRLSKPLSALQGPLRLLVGLRSPRSPLGRKLAANKLIPLSFINCDAGKTLLAIHAMEPHQLKYWGDADLSLRKTADMNADESGLFAARPKGLFASLKNAGENAGASLRFSLQRQRPAYDAVIRVEARAVDDLLTESYLITCTPRSSQVERVLVYFSRVRDSKLRWRLGSEDSRQVAARRLPAAEEAAAGLGGDGEAWEISLRRPRGIPFEIKASRTCKLDEKTDVCLAALPEAAQQQATLVVKSPDLSGHRFKNRRLVPIAPQPEKTGRYSTTRAAYRYDPLRTVLSPARATVTVLPKTDKGSSGEGDRQSFPSAWAWSCRLESFYNTDGSARHWACYHIENAGHDRLTLELPENIGHGGVESVLVNDRPAAWQNTAKEDTNSLGVDLPAGIRFPVVTIHFTTTSSPLGITASLEPMMPEADIPMLGRHWTAWLPPGYSALAETDELAGGYAAPCASPSLAQRIFGPLGQPPYVKPFDPFSASDWKATASDWRNSAADERPVALLLERMGRLLSQKTTVGSVLHDESLVDVERLLLIDAKALARDGISPVTSLDTAADDRPLPDAQLPPAPLPPDLKSSIGINGGNAPANGTAQNGNLSADEAMGRAIRMLRRSGLALLARDEAFLLTTASQAAVYADHLEPLCGGVVWRVCPGPLSDWISSETISQIQNDGQGTLVSASRWVASANSPTVPWAPFTQPPFMQAPFTQAMPRSSDTPGWTAVRLDISGKEAPRLPIVHRQTLSIFRWTAFILAIAVGWWQGVDRPLATSTAAAAFAVLALLVPIVGSSICSGVVLGLLFCLLLRLTRRKASPHGSRPAVAKAKPSASDSTAAYIVAGAVLAFVLLSSNVSAAADPATADPATADPATADPATVYRVFVPVDKEQKTDGGRVFVPEELYGQLQRRAADAMGRPRGWLITSAEYNGILAGHGRPERLSIGGPRAVFDIHLFDHKAAVRIPLKKSDVLLTASNCLLDGRAVRPKWSEDGESVVVDVEHAGRHRLELALQPVEKPNKPDDESSPGVEPLIEAKELLWLKIRPGSVVVDAKFLLKVNAGEVRELMLDADPRLRLLEQGDTADIVEAPGKPRSRIVRLAAPCSDQVVITARFLLREGSGVGNIRPPLLRLSKVAASVRWLAVSIDPSLDSRGLDSGTATSAGVSDFVASWGKSEEKPQSVRSLSEIGPTWIISTRPRRPPVEAAQTLRVTFSPERIGVRLDAKLADTPGYGFQYRIAAPRSLTVDKVSVIEEGVERVSRWTRGDDNTVNIFLTGPAAVARQLTLQGRMPAPSQGKLRVPMLRLKNAKQGPARIALFRDPSVLVSIVEAEGLIESGAAWVTSANRPRLAKSFIADGRRDVNLVVALRPNLSKIEPEVVDNRSHAALLPSEKGHANAAVRLADISIVWREDGSGDGTATFDLQPDGRRWCPLWLPRGFRLIETRLDNLAIAPRPVHANLSTSASEQRKYRIQLSSRTMPQRIEVVFRGQLSPGQWRGHKPFDAPRLGDLPVEHTLWRVSCPRPFSPDHPATDSGRLEHEMVRHKNIAAIIERAASLSNPKTDELLDWYRSWARRYAYSRHEVQLVLSSVKRPELVRSTLAELKKIDSRQLEIVKGIEAEAILRGWLKTPPIATDAGGLWQATLASSSPLALLSEQRTVAPDGTADTKSRGGLSFRRTGTANILGRLNAALAIVFFIGIIHMGIKRDLLPMFARRWPHLLGVAVGFFWWLFLSPSLIGLVIAAACLAASVRSGRQNEQRNDSMTVPLS